MVVPLFGWSAGDLVTSIKILYSVASAFKDASGASSQYKETASWLESFASDLERMREYITENPDARYTKNIVEQVGRIDKYYGEFEAYLQKYDKGLSSSKGSNVVVGAGKKVKWALQELKGKVDSLKFAVTGPIVSLNLLLALQCRVDLSAVADKVIAMPPTPRINDIEAAFQGLHNRIRMLEDVQERMKEDLTAEGAIIRDEMSRCTSDSSVRILSSHYDAMAQIVSVIEEKDVAWKDSLSAMRQHLQNIEETQSRTQRFYEELHSQQQGLDRIEELLEHNDHLASKVNDVHEKLAALTFASPKIALLDMTQTACAVANVAVGAGAFIAMVLNMTGGVRKWGGQQPAQGYCHDTRNIAWSRSLQALSSYPYELRWKDQPREGCLKWDSAMSAWALVIPDHVLWILNIMSPGNPDSGDVKSYFLPAEGIHFDVLGADTHLYLGQRVWLGLASNMEIDGYMIRASICFTEEMIRNLKEDSARWIAFLDTKKSWIRLGFALPYTASDIFKARWQPLRAAVQEKLTRDAEEIESRKIDQATGIGWASSFRAGSWDSPCGSPLADPLSVYASMPPPSGANDRGRASDHHLTSAQSERVASMSLDSLRSSTDIGNKHRAAVLRTSRLNDFIADTTPYGPRAEPPPYPKLQQKLDNLMAEIDHRLDTKPFTPSRGAGRPAGRKSDAGTNSTTRSYSTVWATSSGQHATAQEDATKPASEQPNANIISGTSRTSSSSFCRES